MDLYKIRTQLNLGIPLTEIKLKVTDYSRVSTDHEEQKSSLKNQQDYFKDMIKNNKKWTYVNGYVDDGVSGTTDYKRNNFMKMIDDARLGKFDLIVTKEISRFSRNTLDSIKYTRELLSYGVAVLFINDNINTALPDSELRLTIMASMAQDEIRRLSERVKFGMQRSIKNGNILGNSQLYGYRKNKNTGSLVIIKEEAEIVKKIYEEYAIEKLSLNNIAKKLNSQNIKTVRNKKWTNCSISRIIKNVKYKGYYCGKKTEVVDYMTKKIKYNQKNEWITYKDNIKIPPIINENLWDLANKRLQKNQKISKNYQRKGNYLFSSKIYCLKDNSVFNRKVSKTKEVSWACSKYLTKGKDYCDCIIIKEKELYKIFESLLKNINITKQNLLEYLQNIYTHQLRPNTISKKQLNDKTISLILDKIIIKDSNKDKHHISMDIYLNISTNYLNDMKNLNKNFLFKRGSNKKKVFVTYEVNYFSSFVFN